MFYRQESNQYINEGTTFYIDGKQYPPTWLNQATPEMKAELGLEEVVATNSPFNPVYYWTGETLTGATLTYSGTPKDLDAVKASALATIDTQAYSILQPTDYIEVRNLRNPEYKVDWMVWRDGIRATAKASVAAINACTTVDEVADAVSAVVWGVDPNA
jgi:hypothetical protein